MINLIILSKYYKKVENVKSINELIKQFEKNESIVRNFFLFFYIATLEIFFYYINNI
jgi:hypothetical protein